jgi:hypothetical protein
MIESIPTPNLVVVASDRKSSQIPPKDELADIRWGWVEEFLRHEVTARDIDRYKAHLKSLPLETRRRLIDGHH